MSELPDLPPLPRRTRPLPPGGLEAAVADGRRRRNRFLGMTGGGATALALVLALAVSTPGQSQDSLRVADPEATASAEPEPDPSAAAEPTSEAAEPRQATPEPTPEPQQSPGGAGQGDPTGVEEEDPDEDAPDAPEAPQREPYVEEPRDKAAPAVCQGAPSQTDPYVLSASGCAEGGEATSTAPQGGQVMGRLSYCVSYNEDPVVLRYGDGREHEVLVRRGGEGGPVVWRFSDTVDYTQGAHERSVDGGRCLEWTGVWDTSLADGSDAPPGEYYVTVLAVPDRVGDWAVQEGDAASVSFTVTITD